MALLQEKTTIFFKLASGTYSSPEAQFIVSDWVDKVDFGHRVHRPVTLHRLTGRYDTTYVIGDFIPQKGAMNFATGLLRQIEKIAHETCIIICI